MTSLAGTRPLVRLALRRDRIILPVWIVLLAAIPASTGSAYEQLYPTEAVRAGLTASVGRNPSVAVLYGPGFDLSTPGGFTAWRYACFFAVFVGLMAIFTVTRHTRAEEDTGRLELLSAGVVGRYAALTAGVGVAASASILIGALAAVTMIGSGLPAAGSIAFGAGGALAGCVFAGIAAVTAQLTEYSRNANGMACAALGVAFLLRAVGDSTTSVSWLSWLSPIGWSEHLQAFAGERWWVLVLPVLTAIVITAAAYALLPRRDLGAGLFPQRPGPATAAPGLASPFALAWRLHKGVLIGWTIAMLIFGGVFGSIANGIADLVGDSEQTKEILAKMGGASGIEDAFLGTMAGVFGLCAAVYAVQATLRMRAEESAVLVEPLLATGVSRRQWMASHLVFALVGPALLLTVAGLGAGVTHGLMVHDLAGQVPHVLGGALVQLPAAWVVVGIAVVLFGFLPTYSVAAWAALGLFLVLTMFGPAVQASQVVMDVSPFTHVPKIPGAPFAATPLLWLTAIAVITVGAGMTAFRRRDIG